VREFFLIMDSFNNLEFKMSFDDYAVIMLDSFQKFVKITDMIYRNSHISHTWEKIEIWCLLHTNKMVIFWVEVDVIKQKI